MDETEKSILEKNNIRAPVEGRCGFFVKRKQRYCKMLPAKGNTHCAEHLQFAGKQDGGLKRKRIPCPLDAKHSVYEDKLNKHLKKCNATLKKQLPFYVENINLGIKGLVADSLEQQPLNMTPSEEMNELIDKLKNIHQQITTNTSTTNENLHIHPLLQQQIVKEEKSVALKKHLSQQGSLINIMQEIGSFRDRINVIEFGAGRGALSHWIQKAMVDKKDCKYFLVDRQHSRNKLDCYHKGEEQGPSFERLNIDIQHLDLEKVKPLMENNSDCILAVGKHLCGGATDLSLRCIFNDRQSDINNRNADDGMPLTKRMKISTTIKSRVHSIVFALCCYHRCTWSSYVGVDYMKRHRITPLDFYRLSKMATWSTCAFEKRLKDGGHDEESNDQDDDKPHGKLGLSAHEQEDIGKICKRIIDEGRLEFIRSNGYRAELVTYIDRETTPENVALVVQKDRVEGDGIVE